MAGGRGKAAKPPPPKQPTLSPEEAEQQARRAFAAQAVEAIKALELRQKALPQRAVAERAYNKLLFDFPVRFLLVTQPVRLYLETCAATAVPPILGDDSTPCHLRRM